MKLKKILSTNDRLKIEFAGRNIDQLIARKMDIKDVSKLLDVNEILLKELLDVWKYLSLGVYIYKTASELLERCCLINGYFSVIDLESIE